MKFNQIQSILSGIRPDRLLKVVTENKETGLLETATGFLESHPHLREYENLWRLEKSEVKGRGMTVTISGDDIISITPTDYNFTPH